MLSDTDFRVWTQYLLSSDDFGVMRCSALSIQADNDSLAKRPTSVIDDAFGQIVSVGLLHTFEHQQRRYLYQHDWQDWQKVTYPRTTMEPRPPEKQCSRNTQWLLSHHPGGKPVSSWKAPQVFTCEVVAVFPELLGKVLQVLPKSSSEPLAVSPLPLAVDRRPKTDAATKEPSPGKAFLQWFQTEYASKRHGATYFVSWEKHMPIVGRLLKQHAPDRLRKHAQILLTTDEDWVETTDRGIEVLAGKINWLEERLARWEAKRG